MMMMISYAKLIIIIDAADAVKTIACDDVISNDYDNNEDNNHSALTNK